MNALATLLLVPFLFPQVDEELPARLSADALRAHVEYLASDALEGRSAGSTGERLAAAYIAEAFADAGLQPWSKTEGWFQEIGVSGHDVLSLRAALHTDGDVLELEYGQDLFGSALAPATGRLALRVASSLEELPEPSAAQALLLAGADRRATFFMSQALPDGGAGWGALLLAYGDEPGDSMPLPERASVGASAVPRLWLRGGALEAVRSGRAEQLELDIQLSEGLQARNVLGVLPARAREDGTRSDEWFVLSAHYDHIGMVPAAAAAEGEDRVFNGANDNAVGVAVLIELARELASDERGPARNVLFAAVTAEEMGLVGSRYLASNMPMPLDEVLAVLNFEMLGEPDPLLAGPGHMFLTGYELSDFGAQIVEGLGTSRLVADPRPQLNLFRRSDNYPFAELGVVAHTLSSGGANENYHKVGDEAELLDFEHMESCARTASTICRYVLDDVEAVSWIEPEDDEADAESAGG